MLVTFGDINIATNTLSYTAGSNLNCFQVWLYEVYTDNAVIDTTHNKLTVNLYSNLQYKE